MAEDEDRIKYHWNTTEKYTYTILNDFYQQNHLWNVATERLKQRSRNSVKREEGFRGYVRRLKKKPRVRALIR